MSKQTKDKLVTIRIQEEVLEALRAQADKESRTMAAQALLYIRQGPGK